MAIIRCNRAASSLFASGSAIQYHGIHLTDSQNTLFEGDPEPVMHFDIKAIETAGLNVLEIKSYPSFRECLVTKSAKANSTIQWTQALNMEYFTPVPDNDFGQRLHFADLSANKTLTTASRMVARDFIDLWKLDKHIMPLWRIACRQRQSKRDWTTCNCRKNLSEPPTSIRNKKSATCNSNHD